MNRPSSGLIFLSLTVTITALLLSCSEKNKSSGNKNLNEDSLPALSGRMIKPASHSRDTIIIDRPSAVLFTLDSLQWEEAKKNMSYREHESMDHECSVLLRNTRASLTQYWKNLRIYDVTTKRYLLFIGPGETKTLIDLDSVSNFCGIFLFSVKKPPLFSDMMNIGNDLDYYFKK